MRNIVRGLGLLLTAAVPLAAEAGDATCGAADVPAAMTALPARGDSQQAVLQRCGPPATRHAPVGGDSAAQPPITRWDYSGFSLFFESGHVIDAVIPGAPAPLAHIEELQPASGD